MNFAYFYNSLPENVVTTKMQLFRRADFVIRIPLSFYAHLHIGANLNKANGKSLVLSTKWRPLSVYLSYGKMDLKSWYNPKFPKLFASRQTPFLFACLLFMVAAMAADLIILDRSLLTLHENIMYH